jgi:protein-S-isoprenylcysteine O-methyltransferase Ste14
MDTVLFIIASEWIAFMVFIFSLGFIYGGKTERISGGYIRQSGLLFVVAIIVFFVIRLFEPGILLLRIIPGTVLTGLAGILITTAGLAFATWARLHLGKYWSSMVMIKTGHHLIRTGPYRIVRNPMYAGMLVALIGAAIAIGELLALLFVGIIVIGIWLKITAEEKILQEKFGEEYTRFRREVKALIPYIL